MRYILLLLISALSMACSAADYHAWHLSNSTRASHQTNHIIGLRKARAAEMARSRAVLWPACVYYGRGHGGYSDGCL